MDKLFLKINLCTMTQLHIGTGIDGKLFDEKLARRVDGSLVIPGSSVAGALRSRTTNLFPLFNQSGLLGKEEKNDTQRLEMQQLDIRQSDMQEDTQQLHTQPDVQQPKRKTFECLAWQPEEKGICDCYICNLFGQINPDAKVESSQVSRLLVEDVVLPEKFNTHIRDGIAIDRQTNAAKRMAKYDYEIIPAGTEITIRLEGNSLSELEEEMLAILISEIGEGRIRLGGKSGRGLGRVCLAEQKPVSARKVKSAEVNLFDLLRSDDWSELGREIPDWYAQTLERAKTKCSGIDTDTFVLKGFVQFHEGMIIKDHYFGIGNGFDMIPNLIKVKDQYRTYLPGSSLRGVLRDQAERIARTVALQNQHDPLKVACNCGFDLERLSPDQGGSQSHSCLACSLFGSREMGSRLKVGDAMEVPYMIGEQQVLSQAVLNMQEGFNENANGCENSGVKQDQEYKKRAGVKMYVQDFLAIDRFTGGGSDGKKYDALALYQPRYYVEIAIEKPQSWEIGWLLLTIRDINDGLAMIGYGAAKGFGRAEFDKKRSISELPLYLFNKDLSDDKLDNADKFEKYPSGVLTSVSMSLESLFKSELAQKCVNDFLGKVDDKKCTQ